MRDMREAWRVDQCDGIFISPALLQHLQFILVAGHIYPVFPVVEIIPGDPQDHPHTCDNNQWDLRSQ